MSSPRYIWWGYVRGMVRLFPERAARLGDMHSMGITARYSAAPGGGGASRTTEQAAIRELPPAEQREYDAVRRALERVSNQPNGRVWLRLIGLVYWERRRGLYAAAGEIGISERTARRWNGAFLREVARNFGLLEEKLAPQSQKYVLK